MASSQRVSLITTTASLLVVVFVAAFVRWEGNTSLHTAMEIVATCIAVFIGVIGLLRYRSHPNWEYLFLGTGFLGAGLLDGLHTLVTAEGIEEHIFASLDSLAPWSWNSSRMYNALIMVLAWYSWRYHPRKRLNSSQVTLVILALSSIAAANAIFFSFFHLPQAYYPNLILGRPQELIPAVFFGVSAVGYLSQEHKLDRVRCWLAVSVLISFLLQAFVMSRASYNFDPSFEAAHILKILSYLCILIGLCLELHDLYEKSEHHASELESAKHRMEFALDGSSDGFWDWPDVNDEEVWWSTRFDGLLGYSAGEIEQTLTGFRTVLHPDDQERTFAKLEHCVATSEPYEIEYRLKTKSRGYRWFLARGRVFSDQSTTRMSGSILDIHEQRVAEAKLVEYARELERSNQSLDEFAYVASHDLKAPLRGIVLLAQWAIEDGGDTLDPKSEEHLRTLLGRTKRMKKLLDDLLAYSRAGRIQQKIEEVRPTELVNEIVELISPPPGFRFIIARDMPTITTEVAALEICLRNLISNAIKHHDNTSGCVSVSCRECNDFVEFSVEDDGPGIDPKFHERVFRMFQVLRPRDEKEGSGMGLALVRKYVQHYGGDIEVASEVGKGTVFTFTWPKTIAAGSQENEDHADPRPSSFEKNR